MLSSRLSSSRRIARALAGAVAKGWVGTEGQR